MAGLPSSGRRRTADVLDLGDGRVVKLLLPGFDSDRLGVEARKPKAAHDAGLPAPAAYGPLAVDGRVGHVFDRVCGALMLDAVRDRPWTYRRHAGVLAETHAVLHAGRSPDVPRVKERLADQIDRAPLDATLRRSTKNRLIGLDDADRVLHGDFYPGNVVLADGVRWSSTGSTPRVETRRPTSPGPPGCCRRRSSSRAHHTVGRSSCS